MSNDTWFEPGPDLNHLKSDTLDVFDKAFDKHKKLERFVDPVLRVRDGLEHFCIQEDEAATTRASTLVKDVSDAFGLDWKIHIVDHLIDCAHDETVFIFLQGELLEMSEMEALMERIVGDAPPDMSAVFPAEALGYSISLPGPGYREFAFAITHEALPDDALMSILVEEFTHGLLRGSDIRVNHIVSILGEDHDVIDYHHWFLKNPKGYCAVDILLMELLLGPSTTHLETMREMRTYIETDFPKLFRATSKRARHLEQYADPRCWAWEIN